MVNRALGLWFCALLKPRLQPATPPPQKSRKEQRKKSDRKELRSCRAIRPAERTRGLEYDPGIGGHPDTGTFKKRNSFLGKCLCADLARKWRGCRFEGDSDRLNLSEILHCATGLAQQGRNKKVAPEQRLLLIEPNGERVVLGLDPAAMAGAPDYPPLTPAEVAALAPAGLYLRVGRQPGAADIMAAYQGPTITHWPTDQETLACAEILVGSRDDLGLAPGERPFAVARAAGAAALRWAIVTDGAGEVMADNGAETITHRPQSANVVDATGAGDVFAAGLLEALAAGAAMPAALAHACAWGAAAVGIDASAPVGAGRDQFPPFS
jgi:hypothetical protein